GARYNTDLLEAIELGFLLDLAEVTVVGALERKESRGGHAREDYQVRDDVNFMRHTMAYCETDTDGREFVRLGICLRQGKSSQGSEDQLSDHQTLHQRRLDRFRTRCE
ncbi:MAG: hypothetical protein ACKN9U_04135, partial [Pirellulaceae bacterium]